MDTMLQAAVAIHQHWPWFWPLCGGILGGVLGSFLSCACYRLPRGLSLRQPPSYCPQCKVRLGVLELIPVLSWLALRGRCRCCRTALPKSTLVLEVTCVTVGAALVWWLLR